MIERIPALRTIILAAACCGLVLSTAAVAWPPKQAYDPRPLSIEVEKQLTEDKFSFVVFGDSKHARYFPKVIQLAASLQPTFALLTGDMVSTGHPNLYDHLEAQLGPFMRKIPTWPTVGNHELGRVEGWRLYKDFYGIRSWDYTFDFRNARFIEIGAPGPFWHKERKMKWLEEQLAEGQKAGKLMFVWQHCPIYSVGQKRPREIPGKPNAFTKLCTKYGVVANFAGHEHIYYRTFRDNVTYITQALGGAKIYYLNRRNEAVTGDVYYGSRGKKLGGTMLVKPSGEKVYGKPQYLVTYIQVDGKKVTGKTIAVGGEVMDEFTLLPRPTTQPATQPAGAEASGRAEPTPQGGK